MSDPGRIANVSLQVSTMSALSPELPEESATALQESIARIGQLVPIVLWRNEVIDGRKRLAACRTLGREPLAVRIPEDASATDYAEALNLLRTHYTASQRAMYASRLATAEMGTNRHTVRKSRSPNSETYPVTIEDAARRLGVGHSYAHEARRVHREAAPEVIEAVENGDLTLNAASKIVGRIPRHDQADVVKTVVKGKRGRSNLTRDALGDGRLDGRRIPKAKSISKEMTGFLTQLDHLVEFIKERAGGPLPDSDLREDMARQIDRALGVLRKYRKRLRGE